MIAIHRRWCTMQSEIGLAPNMGFAPKRLSGHFIREEIIKMQNTQKGVPCLTIRRFQF
nr:MAG TPA: hypothetical protein [Caudoviricetes sp.]